MKRVRLNSEVRKAFQGSSRGLTLIEALIAFTLCSIIVIAFLSSISTTSTALITADEQTSAESLARSQMEYVKNLPKSATYDPQIPAEYEQADYSATIDVDLLRVGLQKITIRIYRHGEEVVNLVGYKVF